MYAQMIRDRLNDAFERAVRDCSKRVSTEWGDGVLFAGAGLDRFPAMLGEEIGAIFAELRASREALRSYMENLEWCIECDELLIYFGRSVVRIAAFSELRVSRDAAFVAAKNARQMLHERREGAIETSCSPITPPARKKDWPGCSIVMMVDEPSGRFKEGAQLLITRRMHSRDTMHTAQDISSWDTRVLKLEGRCPTCYALHAAYIPEHWIADGKAVFVSSASCVDCYGDQSNGAKSHG